MNSPWTVLGLDPHTATEKDVKTAYARLIKQHRPDSDPEGFQRVREAYETALAMLKNGMARGPDIDEETAPFFEETGEAAASRTVSLPPELIEAELAIGRAREAKDDLVLAKAIEALQPICQKLRPGRAGVQLWQETLHRVTEGTAALVAAGVTIPQLIHELETGSSIVTHAVIGHWENLEETDRLVDLAEAIIASAAVASSAAKLQNREAAIVALRLGVETGFVKPVLSTVLIRFAFPHVDREARETLIPKVEEQAGIGKMMPGLRKDQQAFWHKRLRNARQEWDWSSKESDEALDYLARQMEPGWGGFGIIEQVVPKDWFTRLEKETGRRQGGALGRFRPAALSKPRPAPQSSSGAGWGSYGWLIFIVISTLARLASNSHSSSSSSNYTPYSRPTSDYSQTLRTYPPASGTSVPTTSDMRRFSPTTSALLQQQLSQADETYKRAQAEFGFTPGSAGTSSTLASTSPSSAAPPPLSYRAKNAKDKADKLRTEGKSLQFWFDSANEIERQAAEAMKGQTLEKRQELGRKCRQDLYKLMTQVRSNSIDPAYEARFLDVLLFDPYTSADQRTMALARMTETQSAYVFLPKWEEAALASPATAHLVGSIGRLYLDRKGNSLLEDERKRLEKLVADAR